MRWHWYYIPMIPFTVVNLMATLALIIVYRPTDIRWRHGCLEMIAGSFYRQEGSRLRRVTRIWGRPGGQSLGSIGLWFATARDRDNRGLNVHERTHTIQGIIVNAAALPLVLLGHYVWWPLYALPLLAFGIAYGGHWLYLFVAVGPGDNKTPRWKKAYYLIWAERQAYRIQREYDDGKRAGAWGG
jgi:hypothetical protein